MLVRSSLLILPAKDLGKEEVVSRQAFASVKQALSLCGGFSYILC